MLGGTGKSLDLMDDQRFEIERIIRKHMSRRKRDGPAGTRQHDVAKSIAIVAEHAAAASNANLSISGSAKASRNHLNIDSSTYLNPKDMFANEVKEIQEEYAQRLKEKDLTPA